MKKSITIKFLASLFLLASVFVSCSKDDNSETIEEVMNSAPNSFSLTSPSENATDVSVLPTLTWETSEDVDGEQVTYTLYLGESSDDLSLEASDLTSETYTFTDELKNGTTYYWSVEASDTNDSKTSTSISSFTTEKLDVLIIFDDSETNVNTVALKDAIIASGASVTISDVSETAWNNTNPSLTGFDAVIHMNGTTYSTEMPAAGQRALVDFVQDDGGHYLSAGFNTYEVDEENRMQSMIDLVLLKRNGGTRDADLDYKVVTTQSSHPVLENISDFSFTSSVNTGSARVFNTEPSVVLMAEGTDDAVIVREFGEGKILDFSHEGNYDNDTPFSNENIQNIIINFINWK